MLLIGQLNFLNIWFAKNTRKRYPENIQLLILTITADLLKQIPTNLPTLYNIYFVKFLGLTTLVRFNHLDKITDPWARKTYVAYFSHKL